MHSEEQLLEDIARLESKLKVVRRKGNLITESQICNLLGKKYELIGEWKEALTFHYFDSEIGAAMDDYEGQLVALNNMALVYRRLGLTAKAKACYKKMLSVADSAPTFAQRKCLDGVVEACNGLGELYCGKMETCPKLIEEELKRKAFGFFERASQASKRYQSLIEEGLIANSDANRRESLEMSIKALIGMGHFFSATQRFQDSFAFFDRALLKVAQLGDEDGLADTMTFKVLGFKGLALGRSGDWSKAVEDCFDRQLSLANECLDDDHVADAQYNLAFACYHLGDYALSKSTILTCIDTIKVRCADQTKSARAEALLSRIFEALEKQIDLERLEAKLESSVDFQSKLDYMFQIGKLLQKLGKLKEAYDMAKKILPFLEKGNFSQTVKQKVYQHVSGLACATKSWSDAMFFCRKWLETIEEDDHEAVVECLLHLLRSHIESGTIDNGTLIHAERSLALSDGHDRRETLEILSHLSIINEALGSYETSQRYRDECLGLALAIQNEEEDFLGKDFDDVEDKSYFGDRKVSKTTKSLMGGDFQMKTRTNKAGIISKRRVKSASIQSSENGRGKPKSTKKPKSVVHENLESASDMEYFIASDYSSEGEKENRAKRNKIKAKKERAAVLISSDSEQLEDVFATVSITASQMERLEKKNDDYDQLEFNEAMNDFGPNHWNADDVAESIPYKQLALRVKVQLGPHTLIVPCFDDDIADRKKISWLIREAQRRYTEIDEKEPLIKALSYLNSDAYLSPNDPISLVLADGQTVKAHIESWRKRSWLQEYHFQLQRLESSGTIEIENIFRETPLDSSHFDLSYFRFTPELMSILSATLKAKNDDYPGFSLDLSGSTGFSFALDCRIKHLDISFVSLDRQQEAQILALIQANIVCLEVLNVSYVSCSPEFHFLLLESIGNIGLNSALKVFIISGHTFSADVNYEVLHFLPNLKELRCEASMLNLAHINSIARLLEKSHCITSLTVAVYDLEEVNALMSGVERNYSLEELDLLDTPENLASLFLNCRVKALRYLDKVRIL